MEMVLLLTKGLIWCAEWPHHQQTSVFQLFSVYRLTLQEPHQGHIIVSSITVWGMQPSVSVQSVFSVGALNLISRCTFHAADTVQYVLHFTVLDMFAAMAGPSFWEVTTLHCYTYYCEVHWSLRSFEWCLAVSVPLRSALYGDVLLRWFRARCIFGVAEGEWWWREVVENGGEECRWEVLQKSVVDKRML